MLLWTELILGLWVMLSPWILGFKDISLALWSNVIAGIIIFLAALWSIYNQKNKI